MDTLMLCFLIVFVMTISFGYGKNILMVSQQFPSHLGEHHSIGKALVNRGHKVYTVLESTFPSGYKSGIRELGLTILEYQVTQDEAMCRDEIDEFVMTNSLRQTFHDLLPRLDLEATASCDKIISDPLINDTIHQIKFNVAVVDCFYMNPCCSLVAFHYKIPFVCTTTFVEAMIVKSPFLPSVSPTLLAPFQGKMNFLERLLNVFNGAFIFLFDIPSRTGSKSKTLLAKYAENHKSLTEILKLALLHIQTRDHLIEGPDVSMPDLLMVPGLTAEPPKPLSATLEDIMTKSGEHGVIVVTFSSFVNKLPATIVKKMFKAFDQLPQQFIMRHSGDINYIKQFAPSNVHLLKWIPQNDLLGHNKTKLFLTHAGNNGIYEAMYHGIPMVAMPLFSDQPNNADKVEKRKLGKKLDIITFSPSNLRNALEEVLKNTQYKTNMRRLSDIMKDRPMSAADTAAFWIEHVMKFGGSHLRSHARDMQWYEFIMLDIFICLVVLPAIMMCGLVFVLKQYCSRKCHVIIKNKIE